MAEATNTGEPRIDAAKRVLTDVITQIPDDQPNINVGFRVFGHEGDNTDAGKEESCQSSDLVVPIEGVDKEALQSQVDSYQPVGWTPIALSLQRAVEDFPNDAEDVTNAIILVTDGLETCQDPQETCDAASALFEGEKGVQVNVVGLGLAQDELAILQCIADNGGGTLVGAQNATELSAALFTFLEELEVVVSNGFLEIESIGGLYPRATITGQGGATDSNPEGEPFSATLTDSNRIELPVGTYDVSWTNPSGQETQIRVNIEADRDTLIRGSILEFPARGRRDLHGCRSGRYRPLAGPVRTRRPHVGAAGHLQDPSPRTRWQPGPDGRRRPDAARLGDEDRSHDRAVDLVESV